MQSLVLENNDAILGIAAQRRLLLMGLLSAQNGESCQPEYNKNIRTLLKRQTAKPIRLAARK